MHEPWFVVRGSCLTEVIPLARVIQTDVRDPLTDEILFGKLENGGTVTIGLENGELKFRFDAAAPLKSPAPAE